MNKRFLAIIGACMTTIACSGPSIEEFEGSSPTFRPEEVLVGKTRVWGIFQDRFGAVRRQFTADVIGDFDGKILTLDETFQYADGETDKRIWEITVLENGRYEGRANDVIGVATGEVVGQALHLSYDVEIEIGGRPWQVHFDDWLLLQPDGVVINRAEVTKFGIKIGELSAFFRKVEPVSADSDSD